MDFGWTDEQLRLRRGAVEFASARLADGVRDRDRDGIFSRELWDACAEFGLPGRSWCPNLGRRRRRPAVGRRDPRGDRLRRSRQRARVLRCRACGVLRGAADDVRQRRRSAASGCRASPTARLIGATGITEPDSGSSALTLATTAVQEGDEWVLQRLEDVRHKRAGCGSLRHLRAHRAGLRRHLVLSRPARDRWPDHRPADREDGAAHEPDGADLPGRLPRALLQPGWTRSARAP